ncbi:hypothetical protein [Actinomadura terrae]|uniref:hypothetical protein n=1 Tax=Actinomadura terrae TaxID=604353 RepID=UPI001FA80C73|nr:hypothetical protein [Actinomadura terrae]
MLVRVVAFGVVGVTLVVSGCGGGGEKAGRPAPSSVSGTPLEPVAEALLPVPPRPVKPNVPQYGPKAGYFDGLMANFLQGAEKPDVCLWGMTPSALVKAAVGPLGRRASIALWMDQKRSLIVQEVVVNLPDAGAAKLMSTKVVRKCRDSYVQLPPYGTLRLRVEDEIVRNNHGRPEKVTTYSFTGAAGYRTVVEARIRVKGHVVLLRLSPDAMRSLTEDELALVDEAGQWAAAVLGSW